MTDVNEVTLAWSEPARPNSDITSYRIFYTSLPAVGQPIPAYLSETTFNSGTLSFTIKGLDISRGLLFQVAALNVYVGP